ncbi:MAG: hypothetical protein D4R45_04590 [Planctomycetaceae bacterium]|nr:MAG: hypothetical protein D4R45_04590 [Planctomycetaceae bacterium]
MDKQQGKFLTPHSTGRHIRRREIQPLGNTKMRMKAFVTIFIILILSPICAAEYSPTPDSVQIGKHSKADVPFDLVYLKSLWKKRILAIKKNGQLPIIDIESSFDAGKVNAKDYAKSMDNNDLALTASVSCCIGHRRRSGGLRE